MIINNDSIFQEDSFLHFYDCDCYERAKLSTILKYIADIAGVDYTRKGFSHQYLWDRGMVFLLSRTSLKIGRMPRAYETVTVSTWEQGKKGSQFLRHFEIFDKEGALLISAATAWLLVNPISRKILRPEVFTGFMPKLTDKLPDCELPGKLRMPEGQTPIGRRVIRFSDLDGNGHVYNGVYGDIAYDFLPAEYQSRTLRAFQINYQAEALLGEELALYLAPDPAEPDSLYLEGRNAAGGNCFVCKLSFAPEGEGR